MHAALIIDEVLEAILEHCSDWSSAEYRWTLCQLARCCKAWKDPALDRLWKRLDGTEPLTRLRGQDEPETAEEVPRFHEYASRVKHIVFTSSFRYPNYFRAYVPFPNLKSAVIQGNGCLVPRDCLLSSSLQELDVNLRGNHRTACGRHNSHLLAEKLDDIPSLRRTLRKLRIKGFMSTKLDHVIPYFSSLRSVTLLTGQSLSVETLAALGQLVGLQDLYVHASHLDAENFAQAISSQPSRSFSALRSLRIRAQRSLFCAILDTIPRGTLQSLYLETEEAEQGPSAWNPTFTLIASKAADSLIDLTLDQILDPEEMEANLSTSGTDTRFALETLQPLCKLHILRRLTIDAMLLPDFADRDIDQMATWWPKLEHLDLGEAADVQEHGAHAPKITLKALHYLAKRCPSLRSLSIPLDSSECCRAKEPSSDVPDSKDVVRQKVLERLVVGSPPSDEYISTFVRNVLGIFPHVREIECTSAEKSLSVEVRTVVKDHALDVEHPKGTSDGFADGQ